MNITLVFGGKYISGIILARKFKIDTNINSCLHYDIHILKLPQLLTLIWYISTCTLYSVSSKVT